VELYDRLGMDLPEGLVIDPEGKSLSDPAAVLKSMVEGSAALLPLGGLGEATGGYKGYGLAAMVEILSAAFQNGPYLRQVTGVGMGHFFIVIDVSRFLPLPIFKSVAGNILRDLQGSRKIPGESRIYVAGEKEYDTRKERLERGVPLSRETLMQLDAMAEDLGVSPLDRSGKERRS
jgi:LDH2 family malate/lactate/ureidoglycolate dehydrogenase